MSKLIIFDFDGTLADTVPILLNAYNSKANSFGLNQINQKDLPELKNLSAKEFLKKFSLNPIKLFFIYRSVKKEYDKNFNQSKPFDGVDEVLLKLSSDGYRLAILTSNYKNNVESFIQKFFTQITFVEKSYEHGLFKKSSALNKLLKKLKTDPKDAVYVADEVRDVEACKEVGVKVISVTWGANSKEALIKASADFIAEKPSDILSYI